MEFRVIGGPDDGPTLRLDHERFAYAGKFVMSGTGKAVVLEDGTEVPVGGLGAEGEVDARDADDEELVVAAASFDRDRTDPSVVRVRYVTVRRDRRGEGIGARLLAFLAGRLLGDELVRREEDGPESTVEDVSEVCIAVNNPFAYEAAFKAGFGYTGERTGLAELVCARPGDRSVDAYRRGLSAFRERADLDAAERTFVDDRRAAGPPPRVEPSPSS